MNNINDIWADRVRRFGRRSVVNLAVSEADLDAETQFQQSCVFPLLRTELKSAPRSALDYGCGWGRFTPQLAAVTNAARVIGYDPCSELIAMAETSDERVAFMNGTNSEFFEHAAEQFDLIFIHAVLGGIPDDGLLETVTALRASLVRDGLLFMVEDTDPPNPGNAFWHIREQRYYVNLLETAGLTPRIVGTYPTRFGQTKSVFGARAE